MNKKWKQSGARLLVCGSLLGSIALIGLYHPSGGSGSTSIAASNTDTSTPNGYYTGPMGSISMNAKLEAMRPKVSAWQYQVPVLQKKMTLHLADSDISSAITMLAKTTGLHFAYVDVGGSGRLSLEMTNMPVWQVMQALADSCGGSWQHDNNLFTLRPIPIGPISPNLKLQSVPA